MTHGRHETRGATLEPGIIRDVAPPCTRLIATLGCLVIAALSMGQEQEAASLQWLDQLDNGWVYVDDLKVQAKGEAWLTDLTPHHQAWHLSAGGEITLPLDSLVAETGVYQLQLLARSGMQWQDPNGQTPHYRVQVQDSATTHRSHPLTQVPGEQNQPIRVSGEAGAWANWYATLRADRLLRLENGSDLRVINRQGHGGILAFRLTEMKDLQAVELSLTTAASFNAFTADQPPELMATLTPLAQLASAEAFMQCDWYDLLTDESVTTYQAVTLPGLDQSHQITLTPPASAPGVYRLAASLVREKPSDDRDPGSARDTRRLPEPSRVQCTYAISPAKWARDLPDDWPFAAHVNDDLPPLPGFKWFRYFSLWPENHKGPGQINFDRLDRIVEQVADVGGRLLIASDGSPVWTVNQPKVGMPWVQDATALPPDHLEPLEQYLSALVQRYASVPDPVLAALELPNEANTRDRWQGTPQDMLAIATVFRRAADQASRPLQVVGLAVSAGIHRGYIDQMIDAGVMDQADVASGHFYEELANPQADGPVSTIPKYVHHLREPLQQAGLTKPIWNSESAIAFVPRADGRLISQTDLNEAAAKHPAFDPARPWLIGEQWREVPERRAAATYVSAYVQLLALGVTKSFIYDQQTLIESGAPALPWVALGVLGHHLEDLDYHRITPLKTTVPGSNGGDGQPRAFAYLIGDPSGPHRIIAWTTLADTRVGRSKLWQPWLDPIEIKVNLPPHDVLPIAYQLTDLYHRHVNTITPIQGALAFRAGEEAVFLNPKPPTP